MLPQRSAPAKSTPTTPLPPLLAVAVTLVGIAAMLLASVFLLRQRFGLRTQIGLGTLALAAPALLVVLISGRARRATVGAARLSRRAAVLSVLLGAALWIGSIGLMELQSLLMPPPPQYLDAFRAIHAALAPANLLDGLVSLAVIAVLPGLLEELVVRGVLLPSLVVWMPEIAAALVSATLFAAMHGDVYRFLFTFTIGFVLGLLRLWTGSLWPPVIAHASLNALTFLVAPYVDDPSQAYTPEPLLGIACLVAGCALAWPLLRQLAPHRGSAA
jgi:membrane protease YdiL (CAAX protease family)